MAATLQNKVAIVTGGSRGIGRAISEGLAAESAAVVVNYRESAAQAEGMVAAIERAGGRAAAIQADMGIVSDVRRLARAALERFGRLDILVNNAGIGALKPFSEVTERQFDQEFAVNARGPFFLIQEAAPLMREGGRIINISSSGTHNAQFNAHLAVYLMAKGAMEQLAHTFVKELGARGITVNNVLPGLTETELAGQVPEDRRRFVIGRTALGRTGMPEEIAAAVVFLAGDGGRWITGQTICVNGGLE